MLYESDFGFFLILLRGSRLVQNRFFMRIEPQGRGFHDEEFFGL